MDLQIDPALVLRAVEDIRRAGALARQTAAPRLPAEGGHPSMEAALSALNQQFDDFEVGFVGSSGRLARLVEAAAKATRGADEG